MAEGGRVHAPLRVNYLQKHLHAIHGAIEAGVDVRGDCAWSLFDNLEWAHGFRSAPASCTPISHAGAHADDSAYICRDVIASNGAVLDAVAAMPSTWQGAPMWTA